jgi:hypothetical protein
MAIAGILVCFAMPPIGLTISILGAGIAVYGAIKQDIERRRKAKLDESIDLALDRCEPPAQSLCSQSSGDYCQCGQWEGAIWQRSTGWDV